MDREKISVILPVYNSALWIRECVESVLAQTWENFEIIILDDHSTDGTTEILKGLAGQDHRIRLICRDEKGVSGARNQGIAQSVGEYVTFLDGDDKLDRGMLETLAEILRQENSDMVSCGFHSWNPDSRAVMQEAGQAPGEPYGRRTVDRKTWLREYLLCRHTHCWGVMYRRNLIENIAFREDLTIGEDMMFLMDLLPQLSTVSVTDYKGYYYRINEAGVTLKPFVPAYMDEVKSWKLAAGMIRRDYPECLPRAESILAVSAMLAAGKIARLSGRERKKFQNYIEECRDTVKSALKVQGARKELPEGYGIKTSVFMGLPGIYLGLYHLWKCR